MKIVGKIIAVIYSLVFTIVLICFMFGFFGRTILNEKFFAQAIRDLDFSQIKLEDLHLEEYFSQYEGNYSLADVIEDELEDAGINTEEVKKIINDKDLKEFVGVKINEALKSGINGEEIEELSVSEVKSALKVLELSEEENEELTDYLNDLITKFNKEVKNEANK